MSSDRRTQERKINIRNKKAYFNYEILEQFTAGIVLAGTEIKSLRAGKASLVDCYCYLSSGEVFVRGMNISEYEWGSYNNHQPRRDRKLLLNRREIIRIERAVQDKGIALVGLRLFINSAGLAKLDIGICRGRHRYDKREHLREKDSDRELDRVRKSHA